MDNSTLMPDVKAPTSRYDETILTKDATGGVVTDILFSGLNVTLSDLVNQFSTSTPGVTLTIYADTLMVDVPYFNCSSAVITARQIDITSLGGSAWPISVPPAGSSIPSVFEGLIMSSISNGKPEALSFITSQTSGANPTPLFTAPTNNATLSIGEFVVMADDTTTSSILSGANDFLDLVSRPAALNAFYAGFDYATNLINANDASSLATAFSILNWICNCISSCGILPATHAELYSQASSLLVTLSIPSNYHYLGVLSSDFYGTQITNLIDVESAYNDSLNQLEQQSTVVGILDKISGAMAATATAENAPTQTELNQVNSSLSTLYGQIERLNASLAEQIIVANTNLNALTNAIAQAQVINFLKNCIKTAIDGLGAMEAVAGAVESGGAGAADAVAKVATTVEDGLTAINGITATFDTGDLVSTAKGLLTENQALLNNVFTSQQLWSQINGGTAGDISFAPTPVTIVPTLSWDNFMVQANNVLSNLTVSFGGEDFSDAQAASNTYLASLQELANYGKALNTQIVAYSKQLCNGVVLVAKQTALKNINTIWTNLENDAKSQQEKINALEGLLQQRIDATQRSLFLAWSNYRSAYLYNNLSEPTVTISLDSTVAELKAAFASIQNWVAGMPADGKPGTTVLPNTGGTIKMTNVPVVNVTTGVTGAPLSSVPAGLTAYLTPLTDPQYCAEITLTIGDVNLFSGQIGDNAAMWITAGQFSFVGITANSSGYVPMTVSTSGQYINGYTGNLMYFMSDAISSHYSYPAAGGTPNVPFSINAEVYSMPTPFSIWTFRISNGCDVSQITSLNITFTVNMLYKS